MGQRPGTSACERKTVFLAANYLENFVQAVSCYPEPAGLPASFGRRGDGRYHNRIAAQTIIRMAAAMDLDAFWLDAEQFFQRRLRRQ